MNPLFYLGYIVSFLLKSLWELLVQFHKKLNTLSLSCICIKNNKHNLVLHPDSQLTDGK